MGLVLIEDQLGTQADTRYVDRKRATLEFATDLWDCRDEVLAMLVAERAWHAPMVLPDYTLREVAEGQPILSFKTNPPAAMWLRKAAWVEDFVRGDIDEWAAAGALLFFKTLWAHPGAAALVLAS